MTLKVRQLVVQAVVFGTNPVVVNWTKPTLAGNALAYLLVLSDNYGGGSTTYTVTHAWDLYAGGGAITTPTSSWIALTGIHDSDSNAAARSSETFTFQRSVEGKIIMIEVDARNDAYAGFSGAGTSALAASGARLFSSFTSIDGAPINPASVPGLVYALVLDNYMVANTGDGSQSNPTNGWALVTAWQFTIGGVPTPARVGIYVRDVTGAPTDDVQLSVTLAKSCPWSIRSFAGFYVATTEPGPGFGFGSQPFGP